MAESKFLRYQDRNNDLLNDTCEDEVSDVKPAPDCNVCKPDACATVPNWKTLDSTKPFFNGKKCLFQITIETPLTTTAYYEDRSDADNNSSLRTVYNYYAEEAALSLLMGFNKSTDQPTIANLTSQLLFEKYYISPRENSRLKLLYSVPYKFFMSIPPGNASDSKNHKDNASTRAQEDTHTATYVPSQVAIDLLKVRKTLNLYERYRRVFNTLDAGNLLFQSNRKVFKLEPYGDSGVRGSSQLASILISLDSFLNTKGFNMPASPGKIGWGKKTVDSFTIKFDKEYKVTELILYVDACHDPHTIRGVHLKALQETEAFKDPTAMAYFAHLKEMLNDIEARVPMPWLEFVKKYTYPPIVETYNWPAPAVAYEDPLAIAGYTPNYNYPPNEAEDAASGIIRKRLQEEGKQLGQDILSPVFGIGDAIALRFRENMCDLTPEQVNERKTRLGLVYDEETDTHTTIFAAAQEQAFKILEANNTPFTTLCEKVIDLSGVDVSSAPLSGSVSSPTEASPENQQSPAETPSEQSASPQEGSSENVKNKLMDIISELKVCGLSALMSETISCLMKGLTLEEGLSKIVLAAFRSMPIENFGELFILLPPQRQNQIEKLALKRLKDGSLFQAGSDNENLSQSIKNVGSGMTTGSIGDDPPINTTQSTNSDSQRFNFSIYRPWENIESSDTFTRQQQQNGLRESQYSPDTTTTHPLNDTFGGTLVKKFQASGPNQNLNINEMSIMEAYFASLIDVYSDDLLIIVDLLNKFPGAQTVAKILATVSCPQAPLIEPSVMDFIHDIELPFCRNNVEITLPHMRNPFHNIPKINDLTIALKEAAKYAIQQALVTVITKILIKICTLTGSSLCQVADTIGDATFAGVFPNSQNDPADRGNLSDIIATSIVGPGHSPAEVENTVAKLVELLGSGATDFANQEDMIAFAQDISSSSTRSELMNAMLGSPNNDFIDIVDTLIKYEHAWAREGLPTKQSIKEFFVNIGNLMPSSAKNAMRDFLEDLPTGDSTPANPAFCATPEALENFCETRSQMLSGRATPDQIKAMCEDERQDIKDDLEDLSCMMQSGFSGALMNALPPVVSTPGCSDGVLPYEPAAMSTSTTESLSKVIKQLKIAYSTDMVGNGGIFFGADGWGMMNMIMSDTMANPRTVHNRKSFFNPSYVDFYVDTQGLGDLADYARYGPIQNQRGAYPAKISEWLQAQFAGNLSQFGVQDTDSSDLKDNLRFQATNTISQADSRVVPYSDLTDVYYFQLPFLGADIGYNLNYLSNIITVVERPHKKTPDFTLQFKDNAKGYRSLEDSAYAYGFNIETYLSPMSVIENETVVNEILDCLRIKIVDLFNPSAKVETAASELSDSDEDTKALLDGSDQNTTGAREDLVYEFMVYNNTISEAEQDMLTTEYLAGIYEKYPNWSSLRDFAQTHSPPVVLFTEIINQNATAKIEIGAVDAFLNLLTLPLILSFSNSSSKACRVEKLLVDCLALRRSMAACTIALGSGPSCSSIILEYS